MSKYKPPSSHSEPLTGWRLIMPQNVATPVFRHFSSEVAAGIVPMPLSTVDVEVVQGQRQAVDERGRGHQAGGERHGLLGLHRGVSGLQDEVLIRRRFQVRSIQVGGQASVGARRMTGAHGQAAGIVRKIDQVETLGRGTTRTGWRDESRIGRTRAAPRRPTTARTRPACRCSWSSRSSSRRSGIPRRS